MITETVCSECNWTTTEREPPNYCPNCGAQEPWEEQPAYKIHRENFPVIFTTSCGGEKWGLWRAFCEEYFGVYDLKGSDVANLPEDFPRLKYGHVDIYWAIDEEYELHGPFLDKDKLRQEL